MIMATLHVGQVGSVQGMQVASRWSPYGSIARLASPCLPSRGSLEHVCRRHVRLLLYMSIAQNKTREEYTRDKESYGCRMSMLKKHASEVNKYKLLTNNNSIAIIIIILILQYISIFLRIFIDQESKTKITMVIVMILVWQDSTITCHKL